MLKRKVFRGTVTLAHTILFRSSCNLLGTVYRQQPHLLIHNIDIWLTSNARLLSIRARFTNHNTTSSELIGRTLYLIAKSCAFGCYAFEMDSISYSVLSMEIFRFLFILLKAKVGRNRMPSFGSFLSLL